jgi:hypothetical protein
MRRRNLTQRRQLVEECRQSGKTIRAWCVEKGIPVSTYAMWSREARQEETVKIEQSKPEPRTIKETIQWASLQIEKETSSKSSNQPNKSKTDSILISIGKCEIKVGSDFDAKMLMSVLQVVNQVCY